MLSTADQAAYTLPGGGDEQFWDCTGHHRVIYQTAVDPVGCRGTLTGSVRYTCPDGLLLNEAAKDLVYEHVRQRFDVLLGRYNAAVRADFGLGLSRAFFLGNEVGLEITNDFERVKICPEPVLAEDGPSDLQSKKKVYEWLIYEQTLELLHDRLVKEATQLVALYCKHPHAFN